MPAKLKGTLRYRKKFILNICNLHDNIYSFARHFYLGYFSRHIMMPPTTIFSIKCHHSWRLEYEVTHYVCCELNEQNGDAAQRQRDTDGDVDQVGSQLRDVFSQCVSNGLLQVIKDQTACELHKSKWLTSSIGLKKNRIKDWSLSTLFHSSYNRCKVVIQQYHVCCVLGGVRARYTHSDADICFL